MKIETIMDYEDSLESCPKCSHTLDELYCRSDHGDCFVDLVVLECKVCKLYFAYWIVETSPNSWDEPSEEDADSAKQSFPLEHSNPKKIPEKCAAAYLESTANIEDGNKKIERLIQTKLPQLYGAGLSLATINFAKNKVTLYLRNKKPTPKGLAKLVAGAIYATANGITTEGSSLWKHQGEGITEEKVEEIFGVTRKTIRRWARTLP